MTKLGSTTLLSGWIHPGDRPLCSKALSLGLAGTFAGEAAKISLCPGGLPRAQQEDIP